jgi:alkylation response protein AidB-like acyl-CoA dehydrogenase
MDDVERALLEGTRRVAAELLAPQAAAVDEGHVPRSHLDALAAVGVLGLHAPRSVGGTGASPAVAREVDEILAGADLSTWFVQVQHHNPVRTLAAAGRLDGLLPELAAGRRIAGIALAHLRRWPGRPVAAERDGAGWRLDGTAPWYTGWGLNDVALVGAAAADGSVVLGLVPARPGPTLTASAPMATAAVRAARTVTLTFDAQRLAADDVVAVRPYPEWAAADALATVNVQPAVLGLAAAALERLRARADREPQAAVTADRLAARLAAVRAEAYALLDDVAPGERHDRRLALRVEAHRVLVDVTTALVVAGAGGSMAAGAPAQRMAREALFLLVQAQTADARREALRRWADG